MKITKDTVVTLQLRVAETSGKLIEDGRSPMVYLHGGYENTLPKLEEALEGKDKGEVVALTLQPEHAFGIRDESLLRTISKREFPPGVKVGGQVEGYDDKGEAQVFFVSKIKGDQVLLDGNHPLAGKSLKLTAKVLDVRAATGEEIAHRHVHGEHGHHH